MNAPADLNPLICGTLAGTLFANSCAVRFLARTAENCARVCTAPLTPSPSAGKAFILNCIAGPALACRLSFGGRA